MRLAYAVHGRGPPVVRAATWLTHLEFDWESPLWRHWLEDLAQGHTVIRYDERGCGLSDWDVTEISFDASLRDLEVFFDATLGELFARWSQTLPKILLFVASCGLALTAMGLYSARQRARTLGLMLRALVAHVLALAIFAFVSFFIISLRPEPGRVLAWAAVSFALVVLARIIEGVFIDEDAFKRRVLVYGAGQRAQSLLQLRRRSDQRGFMLVGYMPAPGEEVLVDPQQGPAAFRAGAAPPVEGARSGRDRRRDGRPSPRIPGARAARLPAQRRRGHRPGEFPRARNRPRPSRRAQSELDDLLRRLPPRRAAPDEQARLRRARLGGPGAASPGR